MNVFWKISEVFQKSDFVLSPDKYFLLICTRIGFFLELYKVNKDCKDYNPGFSDATASGYQESLVKHLLCLFIWEDNFKRRNGKIL